MRTYVWFTVVTLKLLLTLLHTLNPDTAAQPTGLLKATGGLQPSLIIDCSTILPTYTSKLAATIANKVIRWLQ
jgi:3-hydroxyisobutyrate dehydrogenase-like beta-hydroxyacid dehydrogenase